MLALAESISHFNAKLYFSSYLIWISVSIYGRKCLDFYFQVFRWESLLFTSLLLHFIKSFQIVSLRKFAKKTKLFIIQRLVRNVKNLKKRTAKKPVESFQRKIDKLLQEISEIKVRVRLYYVESKFIFSVIVSE